MFDHWNIIYRNAQQDIGCIESWHLELPFHGRQRNNFGHEHIAVEQQTILYIFCLSQLDYNCVYFIGNVLLLRGMYYPWYVAEENWV